LASSIEHPLAAQTLALVRDLIGRRSLTPHDAGCQQSIVEHLAALGFVAEWFNAEGVTNVLLRRGHARPFFVFAGHTDVVPTGPEWDWHGDPFTALEKNGRLYGRGVADMKWSVAAMTVACATFARAHPHHAGSFALLLTSDEEGPATHGTREVVEALRARGEVIDYCLVGEPSSVDSLGDTVKIGRRGSLSGRLTVRGVQGHVAYPDQVRNPIHLVAPALAELATTVWDGGNEWFPPTSFQVSNIKSGTGALNVVPGRIDVDFNLRFSTASTEASLRERIEAILHAHSLDFTLAWTLSARPFLTARGALVDAAVAAIEAVLGRSTVAIKTDGGTSDGRFIADICSEITELGPVNRSIHKVNEYLDLNDAAPLAAIYLDILARLILPSASLQAASARVPSHTDP
jgi:succinyl-diaminopimelate desuccinylase